jgi:hypothetical protein
MQFTKTGILYDGFWLELREIASAAVAPLAIYRIMVRGFR